MPELSQAMIRTFANLVYYKTTEFSIADVPISYRQAVTDLLTTYGEDPYFDDHRHHIADVDGLQTELDGKETPTGAQEKADAALSTAQQYTVAKLAEMVDGSPEALDTLYEIAAALNNDPDFATNIINQLGAKVDKEAGKGLFSGSYTDLTDKPAAVTLNDTVTSTSTTEAATANSVKTAYDRAQAAFQSASDGKTLLANAITGKGVAASGSDAFGVLAGKIIDIPTGGKSASGSVAAVRGFVDYYNELGNLVQNLDNVTVTGLNFEPSMVVVYTSGFTQSTTLFPEKVDGNTRTVMFGSNYRTAYSVTGMIKPNGFTLPVPTLGTYFWKAYE